MRRYSRAALKRLTEPWEEYVGYPYDDLVPKVGGRYPEYTFDHPPRGTVTIGFGHTDAAGNLRIQPGMRLDRLQAEDLALRDMAPCESAVNRALKVEVTQHQFDGLVDAYFNCPAAALAAIRLVNAGQAEAVPAKLLQYVSARDRTTGQLVRVKGLVNRRNAEIAWFNTPDRAESPQPPAPLADDEYAPKAERSAPPRTMAKSKTGAAAISIGLGSAAEAASQASAAIDQARQAKDTLDSLGLWDHVAAMLHNPAVLIALAGVGLALFIWFDRRQRLVNDHV